MSAEMFRLQLRIRRQDILLVRMREAIRALADLADSHALSSPAYPHVAAELARLHGIGTLTIADITREFGVHPPLSNDTYEGEI